MGYVVSAPESTNVNEILARTRAIDGDAQNNNALHVENGDIRYTIVSGNSEGLFRVNRLIGDLVLVQPLDFEQTREYNVVIEARDQCDETADCSRASTTSVAITVIDANDNR